MPETTPPPVIPPDFHPEAPQLGALYPEAPAPMQELPSPGETIPYLPERRGSSDIAEILSRNDLQSIANKSFDPNFLVQPTKYNDESYDRLQKTFDNPDRNNLFSKVGFYPGINNEDRFAKSLSKWQKVGLAFDQMWGLAKETFSQQWATEAQFWGNLVSGNVRNAFLPFNDKEELEQMSRTMESTTLQNYVPLTYEEQTGEFGFGKFATGLGQFGFTLGTIGAFGTQLALEAIAATLLAPETGGSSAVAFGASVLNKFKRSLTVAQFYNNLRKVENTVETTNKIRKAWQYLSNTQNIKAGFGNFYSFTKQWNAAAGEAKFEAGSSYTEYLDRAYQDATNSGKILTYEERQALEERAGKVAINNGITNTGLLFVMNRINMGNVFKGPFSPQRRFLTELGENVDEAIVRNSKGLWVPKGSMKEMFTKKGGLNVLKGLGKWSIDSGWEGVQEVAQGVSNKYWQDYYTKQYDRDPHFNPMTLLGKSISERLDSNESFDEFISGFIIGVPGSAINYGFGKLQSNVFYGKQTKEYEKNLKSLASELNKWEADPTRVFDPRVANVNNQIEFSQQMKDAVETGNIYAYKNLNHQAIRDMVMLGIRTGKLDYMIDGLKDQIQNLKPEEFEALFKVAGDSTNRKSAMDYVSLLEKQAETLVKDYDEAKQKYANPFSNFSKLKEGTPEALAHKIRYVAWENAVQDLVFQKDTYKHTIERMGNILSDVTENLGSALYSSFFTLTSTEGVDREIAMLQSEIASLNQSETKDAALTKLINDKKNRLDALKKWSGSYSLVNSAILSKGDDFVESLARYTDEAKDAFIKVMQVYQQTTENVEELTTEQIDKAYNSIIDYARLNNDNKTAVKNISFLTSPEGFSDHFDRHYVQAEQFYQMEIARRDNNVRIKQALVYELNNNEEFANLPSVRVLESRLETALRDRDFEEAESLFNDLLEEYKKQFTPEGPATEETPAEEVETTPEVTPTPTPEQVTTPQPSESGIVKIYRNRINTIKDLTALNKLAEKIQNEGLKKGLSQDQINSLLQSIQTKVEELAKTKGKGREDAENVLENFRKKASETYTEDEQKALKKLFFDTISQITSLAGEAPDLITEAENIITERITGLQNGTITKPAKITVAEMRAKIKESTVDDILAVKSEVEANFDGKEKQDLLDEVIEKMNIFAEEERQKQEQQMNNTFDLSNIDGFDSSIIDGELNDIAGVTPETETKPEEPGEDNDQAKNDLFNSIC